MRCQFVSSEVDTAGRMLTIVRVPVNGLPCRKARPGLSSAPFMRRLSGRGCGDADPGRLHLAVDTKGGAGRHCDSRSAYFSVSPSLVLALATAERDEHEDGEQDQRRQSEA